MANGRLRESLPFRGIGFAQGGLDTKGLGIPECSWSKEAHLH